MEQSPGEVTKIGPAASWRTRLPFFYGWVVVGSVFFAQAVSFGVYFSFSVFFVALLQEYGWSRAPTAGAFSVFLLVHGFAGILAGGLLDRLGPRVVVPGGAVILAVGLVASSQLTELWQFYLYYGVICALGASLSGWVPCVAVVSRWFSARRGGAIGIASAGIGLGIVAMVPFCQYIISSYGWREAYLAMAGVALFGLAPQAALLQVGHPRDLGLKPDGVVEGDGATRPSRPIREPVVVDRKWAATFWTVPTAMRTARFWLLGATSTLVLINHQTVWVHQVAYLVDAGHDKMLAASVAGLAGFISIPGKIFWGMAGDRLGREITYAAGCSITVFAVLLLALAGGIGEAWFLMLYAVVFSIGYAVSAPLVPSAASDIFAGRNFGSIFGVVNVSTGLGGAIGAWLAGYIFDVTGSYMVAFGIAAAAVAGSGICMWLASPGKVRRVRPTRHGGPTQGSRG